MGARGHSVKGPCQEINYPVKGKTISPSGKEIVLADLSGTGQICENLGHWEIRGYN